MGARGAGGIGCGGDTGCCGGDAGCCLGVGEYRFIALADDGIRVWVEGDLIINGWKDQSRALYFRDHSPRSGPRTVVVEYYDARVDATAVVNWAPTRR